MDPYECRIFESKSWGHWHFHLFAKKKKKYYLDEKVAQCTVGVGLLFLHPSCLKCSPCSSNMLGWIELADGDFMLLLSAIKGKSATWLESVDLFFQAGQLLLKPRLSIAGIWWGDSKKQETHPSTCSRLSWLMSVRVIGRWFTGQSSWAVLSC